MALLFMDGFDAGDYIQKGWGGNAPSTVTTTRFGTGRSLSVGASTYALHTIPSTTNIFIGYAIYYTVQDYGPFGLNLQGDNGTVSHLNLKWTNITTLALQRAGTTIATASVTFNMTTWYYFEISATIADAGGTCVVKLNGNTVINFTGDTRNAGTVAAIDTIQFNHLSSNTGAYVDDLYICDSTGSAPYNTFLNEVRIYPLSPNGAGSSTQFTPSTGANYTTVDELPYSATDYVTSGTTGQRDTYTLTDLPTTVGTIFAVQNNVIAKKTDAAPVALKPAIKSGASVYYGTSTNLGASDATLIDLRTTDPATSVSWTATNVNALEAGFEVA